MGEGPEAVCKGRKVDIIYTDPPWGDSYLKQFATATYKATGIRPEQPTFAAMLERLRDVVSLTNPRAVAVEMSERTEQQLRDVMRPVIGEPLTLQVRYGAKALPSSLCVWGVSRGIQNAGVVTLQGASLPRRAVEVLADPGETVLDPFCGAGYTARAAIARGCLFLGVELNQARADKTLAILKRGTIQCK